MTEQKYRLTVDTLKHHETLTFDGTYEDIIAELEGTQRYSHEPLLWAEDVAVAVTCPDCGETNWHDMWWYWKERVGEQEAYRPERPKPTCDSIREYAYNVLKNDMLGCKKWEHLITLHPLPEEED
jgi:hypothetical protein|nr:MAG TPA: baseplate protein [Caudoviricetes sp.]